jgi:hypothetical protein
MKPTMLSSLVLRLFSLLSDLGQDSFHCKNRIAAYLGSLCGTIGVGSDFQRQVCTGGGDLPGHLAPSGESGLKREPFGRRHLGCGAQNALD